MLCFDFKKGINIQCIMHIYHFNTIPDINIESFLLHTGDVKLLQVTLALILS